MRVQHQSQEALAVLNKLKYMYFNIIIYKYIHTYCICIYYIYPPPPHLTSTHLPNPPQAQEAIAHYNTRDFDGAQRGFQRLREQDPYRLDDLERCGAAVSSP